MTEITQLFDECIAFTDIHFGLKGNSRQHNNDCWEFLHWMISVAKENNIKTCLFLGDWNHERSSIDTSTLQYGTNAMRLLSENFENTYIIAGNHDLRYKEKREVISVDFARDIPNIHLIDEPVCIGQVGLVPWVTKDEWPKICNLPAKYLFGHFEFPSFLLNNKIQMPDNGHYPLNDVSHFDFVFSGHFHKRQRQRNIQYIGNCFPHNFSDVDEEKNRGVMRLKWGGKPEFMHWPGTPVYRYLGLSDLIENPDKFLGEKTYVRATVDVDIDFEDANFIRETLSDLYTLREFTLLPRKREQEILETENEEDSFESVDSVVIGQLENVDSKVFDADLLISIYNTL